MKEYFTDPEYRILLKALSREREICKKVDRDCGDDHRKIQRWVNMRAVFESTPRFEDYQKAR